MGRESRAKTRRDVANKPTASGNMKPHVQSHLRPHHASKAHSSLGSLVSALPVALAPRKAREARLGSRTEVLAWPARFREDHGVLASRAHIERYHYHISTHHHHNEGPIDSAPAHFLASMALRGSPCHRPRMSGPAATAARRLLIYTRQPGSRQEE